MRPPSRIWYRAALLCLVLLCPVLVAQTTDTTGSQSVDITAGTNWDVEVIAFIHARPDEAFRDRPDLNDYRDLPALPALLTGSEPQPAEEPLARPAAATDLTPPVDPPFATASMADAWQRIAGNYQRIGYFRWRQPSGRGSLRRLHDDQPLPADDSLSLGPHYEFDGRIRITTDAIGYATLQLVHRTPLLIRAGSSDRNADEILSGRQWRTLTLEQQRRIQPGRMEYFDSAGLGLLILISPPLQPEDELPQFIE